MAYEQPGFKPTALQAGADLSGNQFYLVKQTATGRQVNLAGNGETFIGVLQNKPSTVGDAAEIIGGGVSKVVAGAALAAGDRVASDASGKAVPATSGEYFGGICLDAVANADEVASVYIGNQSGIQA